MPLRDISVKDVVTVAPDTNIHEAAQLMRDRHVGDLVAVKRHGLVLKPVGIVTDRDIVSLVVANGIDPRMITVEDVMVRNPLTVQEDEGVLHVTSRMREAGVRRLPVVDKNGNLKGIVALADLLSLISQELHNLASVPGRQIENEISGVSMSSARFA